MKVSFEPRAHITLLGSKQAGADQVSHGTAGGEPATAAGRSTGLLQARIAAAMSVARYHGVEPDPFAIRLDATDAPPSSPALVEWLREFRPLGTRCTAHFPSAAEN